MFSNQPLKSVIWQQDAKRISSAESLKEDGHQPDVEEDVGLLVKNRTDVADRHRGVVHLVPLTATTLKTETPFESFKIHLVYQHCGGLPQRRYACFFLWPGVEGAQCGLTFT